MAKELIVRRKHLVYGAKGLPVQKIRPEHVKDQPRFRPAGVVYFEDTDGTRHIMKQE